ncbi:hypothetical protein [Nocardiopsis flavescens]
MVHHARPDDTPGLPLPFLPGDRVLRAAILSVGAAVAAVAVLGLYLTGGLASSPEPRPPGTELRNVLYRITPHEAGPAPDDVEGAAVRVLADVEPHGSDLPVPVFGIGSTMDVHLLPGDHRVKHPGLTLTRHPEGTTARLQPHMPEEALPVDRPGTAGDPGPGRPDPRIPRRPVRRRPEPVERPAEADGGSPRGVRILPRTRGDRRAAARRAGRRSPGPP